MRRTSFIVAVFFTGLAVLIPRLVYAQMPCPNWEEELSCPGSWNNNSCSCGAPQPRPQGDPCDTNGQSYNPQACYDNNIYKIMNNIREMKISIEEMKRACNQWQNYARYNNLAMAQGPCN